MRLKEYYLKYLGYNKLKDELYSLNDDELYDMGLTKCDIPRILKEYKYHKGNDFE